MATLEELKQAYRDAGVEPPARLDSFTDDQITDQDIQNVQNTYGGGSAAPTGGSSSVTSSTGGTGAFTEAQVAAWFSEFGAPVETPYESASQRLARITQQLNSGARSEEEVRTAIAATAQPGFEYDPNAVAMYGGSGAAALAGVTGGNAEVWLDSDTGIFYLSYMVPGTTIPLLYAASPEQLAALFPEGNVQPDRTVTQALIAQLGGIYAGTAEDPFGNPYATFIEQLEREAAIRPWLNDADMLAIMFEAALEGRAVSNAELMQTEWWRTHNEDERTWLTLVEADPMTAARMMESAVIDTESLLKASGMSSPPDDVVAWMAQKRISGEWSQEVFDQQIRAISDPQSGIPVNGQLAQVIGGRDLDTIMVHEDRVRTDVANWLGPLFGNWGDAQISYWAGRIRNDPDAEEELTNMLRSQRMAIFPEYTNEQLTYEDIAAPWRNMFQNTWGQMPDETDPLFQQVVRMNDYAEAGKKLRAEGLERGIGTVTQSIESAAESAGSQLRRAF